MDVDPKYKPLCKLLLAKDETLLTALCNEIPQDVADDTAQSLVVLFNSANQMDRLIRWAVQKEIDRTFEVEDANGLFRNNTVPIKIIAEYLKSVGEGFLKVVLKKPLKKILEIKTTLEVNMNKAKDLTVPVMKKNFDKLLSFVEMMLEEITKSVSACPRAFFTLFHIISNEVGKVRPDKVDIAIGGFIFLRYFCPAIVSPEGFNLVKQPVTPEARKNLILISKTLQNMASGVEFGENEPYMLNANQLLRDSKLGVHLYLQLLAVVPPDQPADALSFGQLGQTIVTDAVGTLHYHLKLMQAKIATAVASTSSHQSDEFVEAMSTLGEPPKPTRATALRAAINAEMQQRHDDFESTKKERKGIFHLKRAMLTELVDKKGEDDEATPPLTAAQPASEEAPVPRYNRPEISFDELERRLGLIQRNYENNSDEPSAPPSPKLSADTPSLPMPPSNGGAVPNSAGNFPPATRKKTWEDVGSKPSAAAPPAGPPAKAPKPKPNMSVSTSNLFQPSPSAGASPANDNSSEPPVTTGMSRNLSSSVGSLSQISTGDAVATSISNHISQTKANIAAGLSNQSRGAAEAAASRRDHSRQGTSNGAPAAISSRPEAGTVPLQHQTSISSSSSDESTVDELAASGTLGLAGFGNPENIDRDLQEVKSWCGKIASKLTAVNAALATSAQEMADLRTLREDVSSIQTKVNGIDQLTHSLNAAVLLVQHQLGSTHSIVAAASSPDSSATVSAASSPGPTRAPLSRQGSLNGSPTDEIAMLRVQLGRLERQLTDERKARVDMQSSLTQFKTELELIKRRLT
ncbi:hypothetical protein CAOG_07280 [Capsaspora owczarzaki ATCC 30864]|uniref:Ras-GAP domain-containing protein n=1 Tax=Capsaspora owczarzaki (strain ATCC 30864) TaxID=595528 RepID=A0A0D2X594_CAPO3|nr:hypothetical protein CAOG_07280 [Capsaspora owczarzaki ATCC 30864]KJE97414.1 hypothetical protein, variant 1 [Capsaspora owczarzaki ATCC 30864]|eukprot:XP_004343139.2 hypothetical protein CAOG_07280 [Capsaspora owczarzaki ATCC 30864]